MNKIDPFEDKSAALKTYGLTSLEDDLVLPVGMYVGSDDDIPIVFDSRCSVALTHNKYDFYGLITPVNKQMIGLGACARVESEGLIK